MDFTLKKYEKLLQVIQNQNIPVYTIHEWIQQPKNKGIIIRHDVDRLPYNALKMAKLEHEHNIKTTYYFRSKKDVFKPYIIKEIAKLGHEIGYHYEDLSTAKGNYSKAIQSFEKNLNDIRKVYPVKTIAMHGKPLSRINNQQLWIKHDYRKYDILGDAFLTIDYSDIYYFTDTGRNWEENKNNIRDTADSKQQPINIKKTDDLIRFIQASSESKIAIVAHPERWNNNIIYWHLYYAFDTAVNLIKRVLKIIYN